MSYDMAIWKSQNAIKLSPEQIYRKLLRNNSAGLHPAKEIDIFFEEFMDYYPDTTVFYLHDAYLTFAPSTSDSRIVAKYLAIKYGLLIYDPQTGIVLNESSDSLTQEAMRITSLLSISRSNDAR